MKSIATLLILVLSLSIMCGCSFTEEFDLPSIEGYYEGIRGNMDFAIDLMHVDKKGFNGYSIYTWNYAEAVIPIKGKWSRESSRNTDITFTEEGGSGYKCEAEVRGKIMTGKCWLIVSYSIDFTATRQDAQVTPE